MRGLPPLARARGGKQGGQRSLESIVLARI
eukprot:COSAG01_NODE_59773_length_298_cov_0.919598_1_plen_29_part_01